MGKIKILDTILLKANETTDEEFQKVLLRILHHTANP
jgi:HD-GYP domain-containing protein (c-di-GMP phosphodiesterase class II)